jgi:Trk K+ transport system NAD-binding subunit
VDQPVILCGLGRVGWRVLEYLRAGSLAVVVIDLKCNPKDRRLEGVRAIEGDCRQEEVLREAGVAGCSGVLVLTSDDLVNITTALTVRKLNQGVRLVLRMFNQNLLVRLGKAVENVFMLSTSSLTAPVLAVTALAGQSLGTLRIEGSADIKLRVAELSLALGSPLLDRTTADLPALCPRVAVLAHLPVEGPPHFLRDVEPRTPLRTGDRLVLCGETEALAPLLAGRAEDVAPHILWASWLRRNGRAAWRTLSEIDLPVKICTLVLMSVIIVSTLIFRLLVDRFSSTADAFYRTISLIATGADMVERDYDQPWQKVFVGMLRLVGAAATAAFTALFTNYLLRARLSGALEVRRIPDSGHVIVCGLGPLGFRTVQELVRFGERVVVVELQRDNRFVSTSRRLGAAVIHGDATVREVLRQAHAATARAVVAATSDDLVNLEVALLVREMNEKQRVVVSLNDPHLAETLRVAARVRFALSMPTIAASAFVAALFGDRVQNVFLIDGKLLAVVDLVIQPADTVFNGQIVRSVAIDFALLPIVVLSVDGSTRADLYDTRLLPGDRLIAFAALLDLEKLLRREPAPRDREVVVTSVPGAARDLVARQMTAGHIVSSVEEAETALAKLPVALARNLTRGQAEQMMVELGRDGVKAEVKRN